MTDGTWLVCLCILIESLVKVFPLTQVLLTVYNYFPQYSEKLHCYRLDVKLVVQYDLFSDVINYIVQTLIVPKNVQEFAFLFIITDEQRKQSVDQHGRMD